MGMIDLEPFIIDAAKAAPASAPFQQLPASYTTLPWPSVASDAHNPGFRLVGLGASPEAIRAEQIAVVAEIMAHFRHLDMIEKLLQAYYDRSPAALVPGQLILPALASLRFCMKDVMASPNLSGPGVDGRNLQQLADRIVHATSGSIDFDKSCSPSDFCATYTGQSLRLETIGLVFALAGRSCLLGPGRGDDRRDEDEFVHTMFRCSTCCLQIAREVTESIIDPLVWLSYENLLLTMSIQGDAGKWL